MPYSVKISGFAYIVAWVNIEPEWNSTFHQCALHLLRDTDSAEQSMCIIFSLERIKSAVSDPYWYETESGRFADRSLEATCL